jgi:membrane-bound metal-dependent hydrolase YbcI (DUF457 family)
MPSPVGHALGGLAAAWIVDLIAGRRARRSAPATATWFRRAGGALTVTCALLATSPDLDLLFHTHRTASHSLAAAGIVGVIAGIVAALAGRPAVRVGAMCGSAYGTHVLLDWLAPDGFTPYGIQALWPFDETFYLSGLSVFRQTRRSDLANPEMILINVQAVSQEVVVLLPIVAVLWVLRRKSEG